MRCAYTWLNRALAALGVAQLSHAPALGDEAAKSVPQSRAQLQLSYASLVKQAAPALADELGISTMASNVIVVKIRARSPARRLRLRSGDVVARVNARGIERVADLVEMLDRSAASWRIAVRRGGRVIEVTVRG
jgi:S1-C subfamily serine protease